MIARRLTPQKTALEILMKCGIYEPEVDVEKIIKEHYNIQLIKTESLPDDISGILDVDERNIPTIFVNAEHHEVRQRFSMAHELAHYVLHKNNGTHIDKKTFFRDKRSQTALLPKEIEANRFAAELLMPTPFVEKEIKNLGEEDFLDTEKDIVKALADKFNVSTMAMSLKFQNIGYSF